MRIRVSRSGGLLGREVALGDVDTDRLSGGEGPEIARLAAAVTSSAGSASADQRGADRFIFHLEIEDGERRTRLDLPEDLPPPARELIRRVRDSEERA